MVCGALVYPALDVKFHTPDRFGIADELTRIVLLANRLVITPSFLFLALLVHLRPNHSRALKYSLVLFPLVVPDLVTLTARFNNDTWLWLSVLIELGPIVILFAISVGGAYWIRNLLREQVPKNPTPQATKIFAFITWPSIGVLLVASLVLSMWTPLAIYLVSRYVLIERFSLNPILYLRAFGYDNAQNVYAKVVAPAMLDFGVLSALVHARQKASVLTSQASLLHFGKLATVPDAVWKQWVEYWSERASLVIVDATARTTNIDWEIETTRRIHRQHPVLILASECENDLSVITYGNSLPTMSHARQVIAAKAAKALLKEDIDVLKWRKKIWISILLLGSTYKALIIFLVINSRL